MYIHIYVQSLYKEAHESMLFLATDHMEHRNPI